MSTDLARYQGDITVTPLKTGGREDWYVEGKEKTSGVPAPFAETDIVIQLRTFFDKLDAQAEQQRDDPIAMVNALARLEALLADVRMVTGRVRQHAADALAANKVRRFTIEDLVTVEGTSETSRTEWQDEKLLAAMITRMLGPSLICAGDGEVFSADRLAELILKWFRVQWRLTPIREAGYDPDDFSTLATDEDGKVVRTPTVRMVDNVLRKVG